MRNIFTGGPNDTETYLSEDLINDETVITDIPFESYSAGPVYVMGDGQEARDWTFVGDADRPAAPAETPSDEVLETEAAAEEPLQLSDDAVALDEIIGDTKPDFEAKRKAKKMSRQVFAGLTGLTVSAIYRIENGRGKPEEIVQYEAAL